MPFARKNPPMNKLYLLAVFDDNLFRISSITVQSYSMLYFVLNVVFLRLLVCFRYVDSRLS